MPDSHMFLERSAIAQIERQWYSKAKQPAYYERTGIILRINEIRIVSISNLKLVDDVLKPDAKPWFHLDCAAFNTATFDMVTDLERWHPVNRRSKRITTNLEPKPSLSLMGMNTQDLEFITLAVGMWLKEMGWLQDDD